eukprot:gene5999-7473_t
MDSIIWGFIITNENGSMVWGKFETSNDLVVNAIPGSFLNSLFSFQAKLEMNHFITNGRDYLFMSPNGGLVLMNGNPFHESSKILITLLGNYNKPGPNYYALLITDGNICIYSDGNVRNCLFESGYTPYGSVLQVPLPGNDDPNDYSVVYRSKKGKTVYGFYSTPTSNFIAQPNNWKGDSMSFKYLNITAYIESADTGFFDIYFSNTGNRMRYGTYGKNLVYCTQYTWTDYNQFSVNFGSGDCSPANMKSAAYVSPYSKAGSYGKSNYFLVSSSLPDLIVTNGNGVYVGGSSFSVFN